MIAEMVKADAIPIFIRNLAIMDVIKDKNYSIYDIISRKIPFGPTHVYMTEQWLESYNEERAEIESWLP